MASSSSAGSGRLGRRGEKRSRSRSLSSSSSSNDHSYLCEGGLPPCASLWTKQHLESLGIFYDESPCTSAEVLDTVKKMVARIHMDQLPEIGLKLVELTKQVFSFSVNFYETPIYRADIRQLKREADKIWANFEGHMSEFRRQNQDLLQDCRSERIYQNWITHASHFILYLRIFTWRYDTKDTREGSFVELFGKFTRLCLLDPEHGKSIVSRVEVKGKQVSGNPDIRFPSRWENETVQGVTMAEVKQYKEISGSTDTFSTEDLSDEVLGQHGAELLLEYENSIFRPVVSGVICIGTKLIFTFLEIHEAEFTRMQVADSQEEMKKSIIRYCKPYDYMDSYERGEILEILFWLGFVQLDAYKSIVPF